MGEMGELAEMVVRQNLRESAGEREELEAEAEAEPPQPLEAQEVLGGPEVL